MADAGWIDVALLTTVGSVATKNDDSLGIDGLTVSTQTTARFVFRLSIDAPHCFVVADGMGGRAGGRAASMIAAELISDVSAGPGLTSGELLTSSIMRTRFALDAAAQADPSLARFGTTAVALLYRPGGELALTQVGDSMAYRFVGDYLGAVGRPHRVEEGPDRGKLTQYLGAQQKLAGPPDVLTLRAHDGARFVLCTDGLWELASRRPETFSELETRLLLPDLMEAAESVLVLLDELGADDNASAIILEFHQ